MPKSAGLPTADTQEKRGAHLALYSPAVRISSGSNSPASKRRIYPIILAKHGRKPLCCGQ
jgi:hypothetical protein